MLPKKDSHIRLPFRNYITINSIRNRINNWNQIYYYSIEKFDSFEVSTRSMIYISHRSNDIPSKQRSNFLLRNFIYLSHFSELEIEFLWPLVPLSHRPTDSKTVEDKSSRHSDIQNFNSRSAWKSLEKEFITNKRILTIHRSMPLDTRPI